MLDTVNPLQLEYTVLRNTFGLTPAESRLVAAVLNGNTVGGASRELKISKHTARSQLKNVFAKVGVHRQAELVRAVLPLLIKR
jgi:DNA-binding CsgD family transcriptional regulator